MHSCNGKDIEKYVAFDQLSTSIEGGLNNEIVLGKPKKNGASFLDVIDNLTIDEATKLLEQFRKTLRKNKLELLAYDYS